MSKGSLVWNSARIAKLIFPDCSQEIGLTTLFQKVLLLLAVVVLLTSGCTTTSTQSDPSTIDASFSNFLVIGVAGDYTNRAYFERSVVSGIRAKGSSASAFHVVAGGNKPVTRETVKEAIVSGGFDAVVVTRVLDTDTEVDTDNTVAGAKATHKDGSIINLFRYDYEELNEPLATELNTRITFTTEIYDAAGERLIWSGESTGSRQQNIGVLIDETAATVVKQLDRNRFIKK